tara:strand:+ start:176 stop:583 length:408 start_codon:yes stop_codon:yes gene_type:complete
MNKATTKTRTARKPAAKKKAPTLKIKERTVTITTAPTVEGRKIKEYHGVVSSEVVIGAWIGADVVAGVRDITGGRSKTYEKKLAAGRQAALLELEAEARRLGGDAVVGTKLDYETVGRYNTMMMVTATGTAVKLK